MSEADGWRAIETAHRRGAEALAVLRAAADRAKAAQADLRDVTDHLSD
jgi:hypothetical protein